MLHRALICVALLSVAAAAHAQPWLTDQSSGTAYYLGPVAIGRTTADVQLHTYAASGATVAGVQAGAANWTGIYASTLGNGAALFWDANSILRFGTSNALNPSSFTETVRMTPSGQFLVGVQYQSGTQFIQPGNKAVHQADVLGPAVINGGAREVLGVYDTSPAAQGVGGGIVFGGRIDSAGTIAQNFASIEGFKENGTLGDFASSMRFLTRANGAQPTERMRIDSRGYIGLGTASPVHPADVSGAAVVNGGAREVLGVYDTSPAAQGVGGAIAFGGRIDAAGTIAQNFASIEGFKENGNLGDFASAMRFMTRANGAQPAERMRIDSQGRIVIGTGTAAPSALLDVRGDVSASGNITAPNGNITALHVYANYQDVAEWVEASDALDAGSVVVLDRDKPNTVARSKSAYDAAVAGVVSAEPGVILGEAGASKTKVATTGRVRVHVDATRAPIAIGDLLVTSDVAGTAMKSEPLQLNGRSFHQPGTIIGKALEPLRSGRADILVLLSLQ